jgi:hypothetical protein
MILPVLMVLSIAASASPAISAASDFGTPIPGQHVYDMAGVLTPAETQALERRAVDLTASGTPVVVCLRAEDASQSQTTDDARDVDAKYDRELVSAEQALELFCAIEELDSWHSGIVAAV